MEHLNLQIVYMVWGGLCPTIPTCGGGNLQPKIIEKAVVLGGLGEKKSNGGTQYYQQDRVYSSDGLAMCIPANLPGGSYKYMLKVRVANKKGYTPLKEGGVADLSYPTSKTRRGRVVDMGEVSPTICAGEYDLCKVETEYRVRKLTEREHWRLMGFSDEDFEKAASVNSPSQLYKQAGNSICKNVLMAIFKELL
jgi:DNA (cytosine-5)-methyltransferase 1